MTKEQWIRHIEQETGNLRPSDENGVMSDVWKQGIRDHTANHPKCEQCKARRKTRRAAMNKKTREDICRDMGLTKVIGAVSGHIYWE